MAQNKIQADYEALGNLFNQINTTADEWEKWYSKIASQTEALAGSWAGRGSNAFQQEMKEVVLPALKRLYEGLGNTGENINKLSSHWKSVDEEITGFLQSI